MVRDGLWDDDATVLNSLINGGRDNEDDDEDDGNE